MAIEVLGGRSATAVPRGVMREINAANNAALVASARVAAQAFAFDTGIRCAEAVTRAEQMAAMREPFGADRYRAIADMAAGNICWELMKLRGMQ